MTLLRRMIVAAWLLTICWLCMNPPWDYWWAGDPHVLLPIDYHLLGLRLLIASALFGAAFILTLGNKKGGKP
ncbi:MAG: hypothetical protein ABSA41_17045 [Terriglobia bacterium]